MPATPSTSHACAVPQSSHAVPSAVGTSVSVFASSSSAGGSSSGASPLASSSVGASSSSSSVAPSSSSSVGAGSPPISSSGGTSTLGSQPREGRAEQSRSRPSERMPYS